MKMALIVNVGIEGYKPWSGAISTWNEIEEANKVDELEYLLEELYPEGITDTQLNDLLWFESDWVYESLGITEEDEEEDDY
jgi:gp187